jgi:serine/threonine protein kinase
MSSQLASQRVYSGDSLVGLCVEQYFVTRKLGQGGMGAVYEAVHLQLQRKAALKVLRPRFAQNPEAVQRFFNGTSSGIQRRKKRASQPLGRAWENRAAPAALQD